MTQPTSGPVGTYWWALRQYRWLVVALSVLALVLVGSLTIRKVFAPPQYEATALVVANSLAHSPEHLPRLAEALLAKDSVAEDAIQAGNLPWSPRELREQHVKLTPLEQNVLIEVTGRAADSGLAAETANSVAEALAEALNRPGSGVGVFSIQHLATPPDEPAADQMLLLQLAGGLVLAVLLPLGTVGLLLAIRSPLSRPGEAAEAVGVPVLGVLWLPRLRRAPRPWSPKGKPTTTDSPSHVPGLQALCQTLFPDGKGSCLLSAPAGEAVMRTVVAGCLVRAMAEYGEVVAVPAVTGEAVGTTERVVVLDRPIEHLPDNAPVVIDGFDNDGITARQEMPDGARGVLIVPEGSPRTGVLDAAEQFADGELAGIVFVRR